jgi:hypothetical protein
MLMSVDRRNVMSFAARAKAWTLFGGDAVRMVVKNAIESVRRA